MLLSAAPPSGHLQELLKDDQLGLRRLQQSFMPQLTGDCFGSKLDKLRYIRIWWLFAPRLKPVRSSCRSLAAPPSPSPTDTPTVTNESVAQPRTNHGPCTHTTNKPHRGSHSSYAMHDTRHTTRANTHADTDTDQRKRA